jgi:hypothetical protein
MKNKHLNTKYKQELSSHLSSSGESIHTYMKVDGTQKQLFALGGGLKTGKNLKSSIVK